MPGIVTLNHKFQISKEDMLRLIEGNVSKFVILGGTMNRGGRIQIRVWGIVTSNYTLEMPTEFFHYIEDEKARIKSNMDANHTGSVAGASANSIAKRLLQAKEKFNLKKEDLGMEESKMTVAKRLLKLLEGEADVQAIQGLPGFRVGDGTGTDWFCCQNDLQKRLHGHHLRTNTGIINAQVVQPVDDGSRTCYFCGAALTPAPPPAPPLPAASPEQDGAPPDGESGDASEIKPPPSGFGESVLENTYTCNNKTCNKFHKNQTRPGTCSCGSKLSWKSRGAVKPSVKISPSAQSKTELMR